MSYAGIEHCSAGFITHSAVDSSPRIPPITADDLDSDWAASNKPIGSVPILITAAANVHEAYIVRVQEESSSSLAYKAAESKGGGVLAGVSGASLELVCHYRLHGNVESLGVLPNGATDGGRRRDSIILTFRDAKISVLEFDDSIHGLRTRVVQRLELMKSRASVLTSDITTIGNSFFFLGSRLGDSLLVQYYSGVGTPSLTSLAQGQLGL